MNEIEEMCLECFGLGHKEATLEEPDGAFCHKCRGTGDMKFGRIMPKITPQDFKIKLKVVHVDTGHIYVRPISNLKPFLSEEEEEIIITLKTHGIQCNKTFVDYRYGTKPIKDGYGFRLF